MTVPTLTLNNGVKIPQIGLGTWQSPPGQVGDAVAYALKEAGYRHIDCAFAYGNEKEVGEGIKRSGVPREEIFITSKVWCTWQGRVAESLEESLKNLGTEYLDLLLIHWPIRLNSGPTANHPLFPTLPDGTRAILRDWPIERTWKQFEDVLASGKVKAIGVSNCSEYKIEQILKHAKVVPAVDQIELHPYNPQHKLTAYLKSKGIVAEAYSPLGSAGAPLLQDEVIVQIAEAYEVDDRKATPAEVLIGWSIAKGFVVLPKSVTPTRIKANTSYVKLTSEDVEKIDGLAAAGKQKRLIKPPWINADLGFEDWPEAGLPK